MVTFGPGTCKCELLASVEGDQMEQHHGPGKTGARTTIRKDNGQRDRNGGDGENEEMEQGGAKWLSETRPRDQRKREEKREGRERDQREKPNHQGTKPSAEQAN